MVEAVDAFDHDQHGHHGDEGGIGQCGDDGGPVVAERACRTGGPEHQPHGHQGEGQRPHVDEVVAGVGQQPARVGDDPEHHLDDHQRCVEGEADGESAGSVHWRSSRQAYQPCRSRLLEDRRSPCATPPAVAVAAGDRRRMARWPWRAWAMRSGPTSSSDRRDRRSDVVGRRVDCPVMDRGRPGAGTGRYQLSQLENIEAESIHIIREVAAEFERPVLLFSGGKDSVVMLRLAQKAFWPGRIPFPVMHIDTGQNFPEVLEFRDRCVAEVGATLVVASVQDSIDAGRVAEEPGPNPSRNRLQTRTLLDAITEHRFDAVFGGARRDEEKARAKERVFSFRDEFGQWDPKNQRPELWSLFNGRHRAGEHIRVFPLSDWTELDVWQYIGEERLDLPSIYYSHRREVFRRDGMLLSTGPFISPPEDEERFDATVRYRTVGDMTCTGAVESGASTVDDIILEVAASRLTERGATRADDRVSEAAMEDRKREGYF